MNEKAQSIKDLVVKTKDSFSLRQAVMVLIVLFGISANIATDWLKMGFDAGIFLSPAYWISLCMGQGAIVVIMLCVYNFMADREEQNNPDVQALRKLISDAHLDLSKYALTDAFDAYVAEKNQERKERAYTRLMERKIFRARTDEERKELEATKKQGLEKISYIKVRYNKIKIVELFSHADLIDPDDESYDSGKKRIARRMMINKVISVIAFGVLLSTLTYQPNAFGWGLLVSSLMKLFQATYAIFAGGSEGVTYARGSLLSALENRAQFVQKFIEGKVREKE